MPQKKLEIGSSVEVHLGMMQSVIARMAANSSASKGWCIAIVSAIFVVTLDKNKPEFALIAAAPTGLFLFLDACYLMQEKFFRNSYNNFVKKLHRGRLTDKHLYVIKPEGVWQDEIWHVVKSWSIWPFYGSIFLFLLISCHFT